jgi:hypothetical protein
MKMKVLNDYKGYINGDVKLTHADCRRLNSALFYLLREETAKEEREDIKHLRDQFKTLLQALGGEWQDANVTNAPDDDYDYGDYQGTFD